MDGLHPPLHLGVLKQMETDDGQHKKELGDLRFSRSFQCGY